MHSGGLASVNRESMHKTCSEQAADTLGKVVLLRRLKLYAQNPHILLRYVYLQLQLIYVHDL